MRFQLNLLALPVRRLVGIIIIASILPCYSAAETKSYQNSLLRGDCSAVIPILREAAKIDPASAGYYLALCLDNNVGSTKPDHREEIVTRLGSAIDAGNKSAKHYLATYLLKTSTDSESVKQLTTDAQRGNLLAKNQISFLKTNRERSANDIISEVEVAIVKNDMEVLPTLLVDYWQQQQNNMLPANQLDPLSLAILLKHTTLANWILEHEPPNTQAAQRLNQLKRAIATEQISLTNSLLTRYQKLNQNIEVSEQFSLAKLAVSHGQTILAKEILEVESLRTLLEQDNGVLTDLAYVSVISHLIEPTQQSIAWLHKSQADPSSVHHQQTLSSLAALMGKTEVLDQVRNGASVWLKPAGELSLAEIIYLRSPKTDFANFPAEALPYEAVKLLIRLAIDNQNPAPLAVILPLVSNSAVKNIEVSKTPLWLAIKTKPEIWRPILAWQGTDDRTDEQGKNILSRAISAGNAALARALINDGINIENYDMFKRSPLWYAADQGETELLRVLSAGRRDLRSDLASDSINTADIMGQTPLMRAVLCDKKETVSQAILLGAALNAQSLQGNSALMLASVRSPELVSLLLESQADHNLRNDTSMTALMIASQNDCLECVKLLVKNGANPLRKNSKGKNSNDLAASQQILAALM